MKRHLGISNCQGFLGWICRQAGHLTKEEKAKLVKIRLATQHGNRSKHSGAKRFTGVRKLLKDSQTLCCTSARF